MTRPQLQSASAVSEPRGTWGGGGILYPLKNQLADQGCRRCSTEYFTAGPCRHEDRVLAFAVLSSTHQQ